MNHLGKELQNAQKYPQLIPASKSQPIRWHQIISTPPYKFKGLVPSAKSISGNGKITHTHSLCSALNRLLQ